MVVELVHESVALMVRSWAGELGELEAVKMVDWMV